MNVEDPSADTPRFKDRSVGLSVYGFMQIVMGGFSALLVPFMLLSVVFNPQSGTSAAQMIPAAGMYAALAIALVWLGIGSIRARRWARALTLVLAWMWLAMGVVTLVVMIVWMPKMADILAAQGEQIPPHAAPIMYGVMLSMMSCMYLVLPGIFIVFYGRADVKATCDAKDPVVRWTDHCPLPVLSLSLLLGFGATSVIWSAGYGFVAPFFGIIIKGIPGALFFLGFSSLFGYLAWATYKLKMEAWWATLGAIVLFGLSTVISFSRMSLMDLYREMNFPAEQLRMMEELGVLEMNIPLIASVNFAVFIGYLLWVRSYFPAATHDLAN
jgi:hypothetical protein